MFKFESPVFVHKNILKKNMLDELRDYPLAISRMMLAGYGSGVLTGTEITWEDNVLKIQPGLISYGGNIYRMENTWEMDCPPTDRLTYINVRFVTMDYERDQMGGIGEIFLSEDMAEHNGIELGRFRLQEGARLRTEYENFEDYRTEFDTVNRIHMPYICPGGTGLWPVLLEEYALELLATGTNNPYDITLAMQLLGTGGQASTKLLEWYVAGNKEQRMTRLTNGQLYDELLHILRERKTGNSGFAKPQKGTRQMILI